MFKNKQIVRTYLVEQLLHLPGTVNTDQTQIVDQQRIVGIHTHAGHRHCQQHKNSDIAADQHIINVGLTRRIGDITYR